AALRAVARARPGRERIALVADARLARLRQEASPPEDLVLLRAGDRRTALTVRVRPRDQAFGQLLVVVVEEDVVVEARARTVAVLAHRPVVARRRHQLHDAHAAEPADGVEIPHGVGRRAA